MHLNVGILGALLVLFDFTVTAAHVDLSSLIVQLPPCTVCSKQLRFLHVLTTSVAKMRFTNPYARPVPVDRPSKLPLYERYSAKRACHLRARILQCDGTVQYVTMNRDTQLNVQTWL